MDSLSPAEIADALQSVGASRDDVIFLHTDISRIGPITGAKDRESTMNGYVDGLFKAVGPGGTVAALTASESYARHDTPYVHEQTPSEQGILTEHIRGMPGAVRSFHPLFSIAAVGPRAASLCGDVSYTGYGYDSPFDRLHRMNALIVCLGVDLLAMSFVHHMEQRFGVPYGYTKEWSAPVFKDGQRSNRRFFAFVRYLDAGIDYDFTRFQTDLLAAGLAKQASLGYGRVVAVRAADAFEAGMGKLREDPFYFLASPPKEEPWRR
ncbi:AAC(3) family N-acetyltransferase [Magnetospira sp. QH-2]|uniref:AAC(3) family N-acetyltransferase n=1 Tax=Magnetospira sp. (strain QH-2) TaxID=1288970 RepID=UPI0003E811D7|nr:AAC(3) family N-acetyltransferase [Magnetospira sp. QH-2]CCQ73078.1 putative Aminoglycoside N(3')-acetyltransferase [Magnetospira sp. QH-2]